MSLAVNMVGAWWGAPVTVALFVANPAVGEISAVVVGIVALRVANPEMREARGQTGRTI